MDIPSYLLGKKAGGGGGSNFQSKSIEITENGTTNVRPDTGYDALKNVNVTVTGILDTSDADAVASDIAISKTAYVNGNKVTGNVPVGSSSTPTNYSANNVNIYSDNLRVDTEQENRNQMFRTGDKISVYTPLTAVASVVGATANKIKKDEVICGVTGTYEGGRDWSEIGYSSEPDIIEDGFDYAKEIYDNWDATITNRSSNYNVQYTFYNDKNLIFFPNVDFSNVTKANACFAGSSLIYINTLNSSNLEEMAQFFMGAPIEKINYINVSNVKKAGECFSGCKFIKQISLNFTNKLTSLNRTFNECNALEEIVTLGDTSSVIYMANLFSNCSKLKTIPAFDCSSMTDGSLLLNGCSNLENIGGFLNLGKSMLNWSANNYTLTVNMVKVTHTSLMNVINNLFDLANAGANTQKLQLGSTNLAKLTAEEIAIATNKGWTVS